MKTSLSVHLVLSLAVLSGYSQGSFIFIYDQESANENTGGGGANAIQSNQPLGQSFTPSLSSVGFIRLKLGDSTINGVGASVYVNLRANSITGPILASTDPVFMADGFSGYPNFFFPSPVALTPGETYFFQPVVQSGDVWGITGYNAYNYPNGTAFFSGAPAPTIDLWFREGIVIPEPSSALLVFFGFGVLLYAPLAKHFRRRTGR